MVELWIDKQRCDIDQIPTIPIDFDIANLTKAEGAREGREIEITLPPTPANNALFGADGDLNASQRFNMEHHSACLVKDDVAIFTGTVYLVATTESGKRAKAYKIRIKEGGAEWIDNVVHGRLSDLDIPFEGELNLATIFSSWEWDNAVRFLPVYRGNYMLHYSSTALPVERVLLTDDYHPFISVAEMVRKMFERSGYTLRSRFFESELGQSLYMSGDYSRTNNDAARAKCDFLARRAAKGEAVASGSGRVWASTAFAAHTIGPIVDTANPHAVDENGLPMNDTFCTNNSFSMNDAGNICFTPSTATRVGFLLHLKYSTEYRIISRDKFCGFDKFEGLNGELVEIELANLCQDYRNKPVGDRLYRLVVFDHVEGRNYRLTATLVDGKDMIIHEWSSRTELISTPNRAIQRLDIEYSDDGVYWIPCNFDWALYRGDIGESGMIDVELDFRLAPQDVSAGEELVLDKFWWGGADPGMKLVISTATSLRPYFTSTPGFGSWLEFKDVAPNYVRQVDLLNAVGEMFNLAFYTDRTSKEVFIEPLERLYEGSEVVDWSDRVDRLGEMTLSDTGVDLPQNVTLTYINADYASTRFNNDNDTTIGKWQFRNPLYGTKDSTRVIGNKLFTTTLNISNILGCAPSASLPQVGDTGGGHDDFEVSFTPRIVCYKGLRELPEGEVWNSQWLRNKYPYSAFVDEQNINLCFEDRNGIEGLHHHYLPMLHRQRDGRRVTIDVCLSTAEIATLLTSDGTKPSLRTKFRLNINGESGLFRLAKVGSWNTDTNIVQCCFEQEINDTTNDE